MAPRKKKAASSPSFSFPSFSLLVLLTAVGLKALSMFLFHYIGTHLDRTLPSHFATDAPSLLGVDRVERVPITYKEQPLQVTVLVKDAQEKGGAGEENEGTNKKEEAPVLMLLHGFPDDAATFHGQITEFSQAGFEVIVPVLPGYEPATALLPQEAYALPALAQMLEQIIDWSLKGKHTHTRVALVGHDCGAVLSYFLARSGSSSGKKIASLVTIAVPHNALSGILQYKRQLYNSWYM